MDLIDYYGLDEDPKTSTVPADASDQSLLLSTHAVLIPSAAAAAEGSLVLGAPLKTTCALCDGVVSARA